LSTTNGTDALDNFYTDQSFVDRYKTTRDQARRQDFAARGAKNQKVEHIF